MTERRIPIVGGAFDGMSLTQDGATIPPESIIIPPGMEWNVNGKPALPGNGDLPEAPYRLAYVPDTERGKMSDFNAMSWLTTGRVTYGALLDDLDREREIAQANEQLRATTHEAQTDFRSLIDACAKAHRIALDHAITAERLRTRGP